MPNPVMFLGMAIQAFITAFLMNNKLPCFVSVNPGQQCVTGILFLITAAAFWTVTPKK